MMSELGKWFETMSKIGVAEGGGYYRASYTPEEKETFDLLTEWMQEAGLEVRRDAVGNMWGKSDSSAPKTKSIVVGSHLDSVRNGGNYDGVHGVLGGLLAVKNLIKKHGKPVVPIEVVSFTGEEGSRFPIGLMGSHAVAGTLDKNLLYDIKDEAGTTVAEAMQEVGLDPERLDEAVRQDLGAYLEMHIEQGRVLEEAGKTIGVVNSIVGTQQFHVTIYGQAEHAGTTPMKLRQDPMVYAARAIARFPDIALNSGEGVITVGRIWSKPSAENVIPGEVSFTLDIRHPNEEVKKEMIQTVKSICEEEARPGGKDIKWTPYPNNTATPMSEELQTLLEDACKESGHEYLRMLSGAGHDTLNMAKLCKVGMLFIPCKDGLSHSPEEYATIEDMEKSVAVLEKCLYKLAYEDALGLAAK